MTMVAKMAGFGGVGGLLYWLLVNFAGDNVSPAWPWYGQIVGLVILGAAAGCVGVYMITASDVKRVQTCIFAMLCGIVWKPVLNQGIQTVQNGVVNKQASAIADQTSALQSLSQSGSAQPQAVQSQLEKTAPTLLNAVDLINQAQTAGQRAALVNSASQSVEVLKDASARTPASVAVIRDLAAKAIQSNEPTMATRAIQSLGSIANESKNPDAKQAALTSLQQIHDVAQRSNQPSAAKLASSLLQNNKT